ncbi:MAG: hypothetical protein HYV59_05670 [Planctomycetes bacterium]|nr:hypothetical protein [Planctomycetota bacterium]
MKNRLVFLLVGLLNMIIYTLGLSAESALPKQNIKDYRYYWEKGNRGEHISTEEFNLLMSELEKKLTDLKTAFSKVSIDGDNFSYETGKIWEIELQQEKKDIDAAFKYMNVVNNNPNSMILSLVLYVVLMDIKTTAYDFNRIDHFEKTLNKTHVYLSAWCTAFQKAHLIPLAAAKDKGVDLYEMKK